jgi:hypothetical protein
LGILINLTPAEEARLSNAAAQNGLAPEELAKRPISEHLPASAGEGSATLALFAQWAEQDARLTADERDENTSIYAEIEKNGIPRVRL